MLKLYNKEHVAIDTLTDTKDLKIEYVLSGEDLLEFSLSISDEKINLLEEEGYIRTKDNEYVIKAIDPNDNFKRFSCNINVEALVGKAIASFDTSNNNVNDTIRLAIAGTGWILADNNITKRRTVRLTNTNALEVLREVRKVFRVDIRYDAINKIIYVYEQFGEDRGVYFSDELNLKSFSIPSDTYDYVTRLYPKGKDGLTIASINNGKEYIENFQYSNKVLELIWEDNRYTDVNSLKEDAEIKLDELSKPKRTYQASISDLAKQSEEYNFLDFFLGDTITLLSKQEKFRDKQRIVKYIQYPDDPSQNSCELGNTTLTFEELQKENEAKNNTIDAITSDNGTIDGSKVENLPAENITNLDVEVAKIVNLEAISIKVNKLEAANVTITGKLNAIEGEFGTLKANVATIDKITVTHTAQINNLEANKASITQLEAVSATIGIVESEVAKIQTLVNGNLTSENIHSLHLTSASVTVENGFIKNAMIENLDVSKVNAGDISTNKFRIKSDDGGIEIVGATQQFKDKNNKVRVQIGRDKNNNFTFSLFDETGVGVLIDHTGIKKGSIANDLIISDMIASDSVGEKQINYTSFVTGFNKDTNTNTIKSTKIMLNNQNQTLDIAFNSIKTQVDTTKALTESHSTTIGIMQGQISTAINNTQIVKDGQTILLKDDYNRTVQTIDSMKNTISSHTSQISGLNSTVSTQGSSINQLKSQIALKVEQTDITTAVNNIEIGGRNLLLNSNFSLSGYWSDWGNPTIREYITSNQKRWCHIKSSGTAQFQGIQQNQFRNGIIIEPNTKYTFSIKIYGEKANQKFSMGIHWKNSISNTIVYQEWKNNYTVNATTSATAEILTLTFTTRDVDIDSFNIMIGTNNSTTVNDIYFTEIKFEKGNKVTDWTPAPEDVDSSISSIDSKITTTNNKVSSIETNLSSITSRVSNVENTTATINGNVTNLQTRMNTAEQKITATAITNTITEQINNGHILVNTSSTKLDKYGFHFIKNNQKLSSLKNGGLYGYNSNNGKFLGSMQPILPTSNSYSSFGFLANGNCDMFQIAYAPSWVNDTENITGAGLTSVFNINFVDKSSAGITKGAYLYTNLNLTGYLAMNGNNIIGANAIGASEFQCNKFYSTNGGKPILMEYLGSELKIYPTVITGKMYPSYNNGLDLGQSTHRYRTVYSVNSLNTSDRSYKENIEYLNSNIGISKLNEDITLLDMHEFIKNDLHLAKYNYIDQKHKEFGFIADDIVCTKVGSKLIIGKKGEYSYSVGSYISVIVGALKTEINIRDNQIKILEERISKLENLVKI
nr:phage tail spike protein [uncultured Romboutsia sp.]